MKKNIIITSLFSLLLSLIIFSGCKNNDSNTEEYIIHIDSITHADTIGFGVDLPIKFYGVIGSDGCYAFNNFEVYYSNSTLSVTSWGIHTKSDMCTQAIPYLDGETLLVSDIPEGEMTIEIVQEDGTSFTQSVFVKK